MAAIQYGFSGLSGDYNETKTIQLAGPGTRSDINESSVSGGGGGPSGSGTSLALGFVLSLLLAIIPIR